MAIHPLIDGHAPGFWGRDIRNRIASEFIPDKVMSQNLDKIMAMGLPYALWREADAVQQGLTQCSCFKTTAKQPDIPCLSCYGTGSIPGYFKFGTKNYWQSSIDPVWTLTNTVLDNENRPYRIMLSPGFTTGTAISADQSIDTTSKILSWELKVDGFTRDGGINSTITTEFSVDSGTTWSTFSVLNLETAGVFTKIRFRVTLTRTTAAVKTPMFEMIRFRFGTYTDISRIVQEPVIRIIPTWLNEAEIKQVYGLKLEANGKALWTMPLSFFDLTIPKEGPLARIGDDAFVEVRYGGEVGFRYDMVDFSYSDTFSVFTRQAFSLRKIAGSPGSLSGEIIYKVF